MEDLNRQKRRKTRYIREEMHDNGKNSSSFFGLCLTLVLLQYRAY